MAVVVAEPRRCHTHNEIENTKYQPECEDVGKVERQTAFVLRYVAVVVVGDAQIEQNIENEREIEQRKIKSVLLSAHNVLHSAVDSENPERLDQQVQEDNKN